MMNEELAAAATRLADVLQQENQSLSSLDLPRAADFTEAKRAALEAFIRTQEAVGPDAAQLLPLETAERLRDLAQENRTLLGRAIEVQSRVIGVISRAIPPGENPVYAASGALSQPVRPIAFTLSARA